MIERTTTSKATPAETNRRLHEYRDQGYENRTMPHILYRPPFIICPWPGCNRSITGIDFQLELMGDRATYQRLMAAWWKGNGLIGRCPDCGNHVRFTMQDKQCVNDLRGEPDGLLPDDWDRHAYLID